MKTALVALVLAFWGGPTRKDVSVAFYDWYPEQLMGMCVRVSNNSDSTLIKSRYEVYAHYPGMTKYFQFEPDNSDSKYMEDTLVTLPHEQHVRCWKGWFRNMPDETKEAEKITISAEVWDAEFK